MIRTDVETDLTATSKKTYQAMALLLQPLARHEAAISGYKSSDFRRQQPV